tara:strand:- start:244 stop:525 length:282 start_codon:yes stop_codon:yes gene_type:complete
MVKSKEEIQKVKILMDKVIEQTDEIDRCRERVAQLGRDRRELFSVLRLHGKTYRELAEATGLHQVTIQQNMGRFKDDPAKEEIKQNTVSVNGL